MSSARASLFSEKDGTCPPENLFHKPNRLGDGTSALVVVLACADEARTFDLPPTHADLLDRDAQGVVDTAADLGNRLGPSALGGAAVRS